MGTKKLYELKIKREFKDLIRPISKKEYLQLEENLLRDGCTEPIVTWDGYIVDGHNRYEICWKHKIPFEITILDLEFEESVIAWICAHQLSRQNISEETRKYLIGTQYASEKLANNRKNARGHNQYTERTAIEPVGRGRPSDPWGHRTATKIATENNISIGTVQKYGIYARALEEIRKKTPELLPRIFSGQYKISHENIIELSKRTPAEIRKVWARIEDDQATLVKYKRSRTEIRGENAYRDDDIPGIKKTPEFDPDAEVTGLTLTIPMWISSIERVEKKSDLKIISVKARNSLLEALIMLNEAIKQMVRKVEEK
ncbi:MAG: hypothetical protein IJ766_00055 [Clostridia bacterium]|nr:hypothetical protein [Clostridia bacterium]